VFAMRFHTVDARSNPVRGHGSPNIDCSSTRSNPSGAAQCNAAWSRPSTSVAQALPKVPAGDGDGKGHGDGDHPPVPGIGTGPVPGVVTGVTGAVTGVTGSLPARIHAIISPIPILGRVFNSSPARGTAGGGAGSSQAAAASAQPGGAAAQGAPLLVLPAPSRSAVLGPVPLPVPVIDSVAAGVGGSLPWKWFALLAMIDLGLIVGIVLRRRNAQHDRLRQR
jgi:hypothetical protein